MIMRMPALTGNEIVPMLGERIGRRRVLAWTQHQRQPAWGWTSGGNSGTQDHGGRCRCWGFGARGSGRAWQGQGQWQEGKRKESRREGEGD